MCCMNVVVVVAVDRSLCQVAAELRHHWLKVYVILVFCR